MTGHVIICHGLQSGPDATKATALSKKAEALGWSHERPDFRDLDAIGELGDVLARIARLKSMTDGEQRPLVLAGSSMGAFISARVSLEVPIRGLFLMAPPIQLQGYSIALDAATVPTRIVHGWHDELIPAAAVVAWAQTRSNHLVLVDDDHRLSSHVDFCAEEFGRFLQEIS